MIWRPVPFAAAVIALAGLSVSACGGSSSRSSASGSGSSKAEFCSANASLDKAGSGASSPQDFLAVLKANSATLATLEQNAPAGKVGDEAKAEVNAAKSAVSSNSVDPLQSLPRSYGGDIDTYCGVDGSGNPLPSYFGSGKGSRLCAAESQIDAGTSQAQSPDDVLAFLKAHQDLVSQVSAGAGSLPSSVKSEAEALVTAANQAISSNDSASLGSQDIMKDAADVDLYCGVNQ